MVGVWGKQTFLGMNSLGWTSLETEDH
jgi:hypothetical protein